jgi:sugar lactone lactonase YvrE
MRADQVTDPVAYHGEGPVWCSRWGGLRWLDMLSGDVLSLGPDSRVGRRHVGSVVAALRPRKHGGAVIGLERGFAMEEPDGTIIALSELWTSEHLRMNEGGCDPDGRFYCGSMAYDRRQGAGSLYRLDPDRTVHRVLDGLTISNGLEWNPAGSRAYLNDTETQTISVFDYAAETGLTARRPFAVIPGGGRPDGLTVDSEGCVWVAISNRGAVWRFAPDGRHDGVIEVPAKKVTACTFGGERLDELFITTSREGLELKDDPLAGALFRAYPRVTGLPAREFSG